MSKSFATYRFSAMQDILAEKAGIILEIVADSYRSPHDPKDVSWLGLLWFRTGDGTWENKDCGPRKSARLAEVALLILAIAHCAGIGIDTEQILHTHG